MQTSWKRETFIKGIPVSEGIAIGEGYFLKPIDEDVPDFAISLNEVDAEVARYRKALFSSKKDLHQIREDLALEGSDEAVSTIDTHIQMLDDPIITTHMEGKIRQMLRNTESVFHSVIHDYEDRFCEGANDFFRERLIDVQDVSKRILGHLREKQNAQISEIPPGSIVFSQEIAPSYPAAAHPAQIGAFVTNYGGGNSHAALIARSKGIPYIAGVDISELEKIYPKAKVIIDGYDGIIIFHPSEKTIEQYQEKQKQMATRYQFFLDKDHLVSETLDKYQTNLYVNVGNPQDLETYPYKHDGVGLFRTEYLFLQTEEFYPSEEYQYKAYLSLIEKMGERPIVIRVFDLGGDKHPSLYLDRQKEPNPVLGNRGIRFLLRSPNMFKSQLRAIFRAAIGKNVKIMLPLISDIGELHKSKELIEEVKKELREESIEPPDLPLGCMIEVPSAVMICDALASECDFLSMGTNDLVQYTLGVDRGNPIMSEMYYPAHPSVLRMIKIITTEAKRKEIPLTICGEIASSTLFTPLLLGLGLCNFSISPRYLPHVKQAIRMWTILESYQIAEAILRMSDPKEIIEYLKKVQKKF